MIIASIIVGIIVALFFGPAGFGVGVVGTMLVLAIFKIIGDVDSINKEEKEKEELAKRGLKKIKVTRTIEHHYEGVFSPYDSEEVRTEEIIVPINYKEK